MSAYAVRRYIAVTGSALSFDDASDELIELCAETWRRYLADPARQPKVTRTGAYCYRGPGPRRLQLIVVMDRRREGSRPQLVDVCPTHGGLSWRRQP